MGRIVLLGVIVIFFPKWCVVHVDGPAVHNVPGMNKFLGRSRKHT